MLRPAPGGLKGANFALVGERRTIIDFNPKEPLATSTTCVGQEHRVTPKKKSKSGKNYPKKPPDTKSHTRRSVGKTPPTSSLIVGIGASAGGLDAFKTFFANMPPDSGMAFVLVQHLSPDHKSMLADLIGRSTTMPVIEAENNMPIVPNTVYVIPPDATLTLKQRSLHVSRPAPPANAADRLILSFRRWPKSTERTPSASFFRAQAPMARSD
jgi:chemotaxis response regulator CheB